MRTSRIAAWALAAVATVAAGAVQVRRYDTRLDVDAAGGARAEVRLQIAGAAGGPLIVPLGWAAQGEVQTLEAPEGARVALRARGATQWLEVELPAGRPDPARLALALQVPSALYTPVPEQGQKPTLPEGSRLLRHVFVNTQEAVVGRYTVTVLLPPGTQVHRIREQLPAPRRKEFEPRVELDRFDGRQGAVLQMNQMRQGDRTSMELEVVEGRRSLAWLIALAPLALGYLFAFRDLVRRPPA